MIKANLLTLTGQHPLPQVPEFMARKLAGPKASKLEDADCALHEREYQHLWAEQQTAHERSSLPEAPASKTVVALDDLPLRVRLQGCREESR